ncbi:MAG TPA: hypothetical protein DCZ04_02030 [Syntrophorhabdus aromaticivorans]|nr:hypothetical protein [Syntrophorhabdus aromaticivorans]
MKDQLKRQLEQSLPPMIPRKDIGKYGVPYSAGYLANLDSTFAGPGAIRIGRRVCYEKAALIAWLLQRIG